MIIKSYVALGFVINIDNMFSDAFPQEIKDTANDLILNVGQDQNTLKKIAHRIRRSQAREEPVGWISILMNLFVNFLFFFFSTLYTVFYYYFAPLLGIVIQFIGFYYMWLEKI